MISTALFIILTLITIYLLVISTYSFASIVQTTTNDGGLGGNTPLFGDVTGTINNTVVSNVDGQSSANINETVTLVLSATDQDIAGTLVRRSGATSLSKNNLFQNNASSSTGGISTGGIFDIDQITILGPVVNPTDTATKEYVDTSSVLMPKTPVIVVSLSNITLSGALLIDGVTTSTGNRILVNGQTDATQNGIWIANSVGAWTRSTDMPIGSIVGQAFVLVTSGTVNGGSNWISNTPAAIVGTNAIGFVATSVSAPSSVNFTGPLSGDVTGHQSSTVVSLVGGQTSTNVANAIVIVQNATNTNTANTLVLRDSNGDFSADIISSDLNGDVTGNLFGNATTATNATTAVSFTGPLSGDVSGNQTSTVVSMVGGQSATNIANATILSLASTSNNTASTIVRRDGLGNFSAATITSNLTGNVTGNLSGNATTATSATTATTSTNATNFTGSLSGDVIGNQSVTVVSMVGGQTASAIANAANLVSTSTNTATPGTLVLRDGSGDFVTNQITINTAPINATDVATKAYVDTVASLGLNPKTPALVVSTTAISSPPNGGTTSTIDGIGLVNPNRVLLTAQADAKENGLWVFQVGNWTRPTDFANGSTVGQAYVLITSGTVNAGSSWLSNTPTAVVGTNNIGFIEFSLPSQITAANVGSGAGIFRDKTGVTLNLRSLIGGTHLTATQNTNDVTLTTDATNTNTFSTIVARDGSGNFSANNITSSLTGAASLNVLKSGDSMTGALTMSNQNPIRYGDSGSNYVGIQGPTTVSSNYTVSLPPTAPLSGQYLQATTSTPTNLAWASVGGNPIISKAYYVSKGGNDANDGSYGNPFLTIKHALIIANAVATTSNPVSITIGPGIFFEDNSGGPLLVTADGITIIGNSNFSTIIIPTTGSNDLFMVTTSTVEFSLTRMDTGGASNTANAINFTLSVFGDIILQSVVITRFQTGLNLSTSVNPPPIVTISDILISGCGTAIVANNIAITLQNSALSGSVLPSITPANTGINLSGPNCILIGSSNIYYYFNTAKLVTNQAQLRSIGDHVNSANNSVVANGGALITLSGINYTLNNSSTINIQASGVNTFIEINGSNIDGSINNTPLGTGIICTTGAQVLVHASSLRNLVTALVCGQAGDTSTTIMTANAATIANSTVSVQQLGTSSFSFVAGILDSTTLSIANGTNVHITSYDSANDNCLGIGNTNDTIQNVYELINTAGGGLYPTMIYQPNYYGYEGTIYTDHVGSVQNTINGTQGNVNVANYLVTLDRTKSSALTLISDTSGTAGNGANVRGWNINKVGTSADLQFTYSNNDTSGQAARAANPIIQFNGFDNQLEFPTASLSPLPTNTETKLIWGSDTTLYRSSNSQLKTDGALVVGSLTPSRVVYSDSSDILTSSSTTSTELGYLSGVTSAIQTQLNGKVSKSGDTMTGPLTMIAGTASAPSIQFTGSATNTGIYTDAPDSVSITAAGVEKLSISTTGVTIEGLNSVGVVHTNGSGLLSTSLVTNADVSNSAGIVDSKLATISTAGKVSNSATTATAANTASTIVARDGSGNFSAGTITATLNGSATSAGSFSGSLSGDVTGTQSATVVSLVGGVSAANVASGANAANAASSTNTPSTIIKRDGSGNFSAGTITASLTGAASLNVLKSGDTMTGPLILPNETSATTPALQFTGSSTNTGIYTPIGDSISIATSGLERLNINPSGGVTVDNLAGSVGIVHSDVNGLLSNSLIVNVDISNSANITDSKLATISSANKVSNSATTATASNIASTIIARDGSGNFSAGTITANLTGNATNFTGSLSGDVTGTQSATVVSLVGGVTATNVATGVNAANAATSANTASTIIKRDGSGNFNVNEITINGTVTNPTDAATKAYVDAAISTGLSPKTPARLVSTSNIASLSGAATIDGVTTNPGDRVLLTAQTTTTQNGLWVVNAGAWTRPTDFANGSTVGQAYVLITAGVTLVGSSWLSNTPTAVVGTNAIGFVEFTLPSQTTGANVGTGAGVYQSTTGVTLNFRSLIGGTHLTTTQNTNDVTFTTDATNLNTASTIVARDASGNFSAGTITANLTGNASGSAATFTGSLTGDVTGTQSATVVSLVGGVTAANVATGANAANSATSTNTVSTIVKRDGSGNFSAGVISAGGLNDAALTASMPVLTDASKNLVSGNIALTNQVSGVLPVANGGTNSGTALTGNKIILSNNAGTAITEFATVLTNGQLLIGSSGATPIAANITSSNGSITITNSAGGINLSGNNFTGSLSGDVTGIQSATVVSLVGGVSATNVALGANAANAAVSTNTASTIVKRDASGNFSAGTITANLTGNASGSAGSFTGSLAGDVTGTQSATVVSLVGGISAANVATGVNLANAATSANTASTIVRRDASGNFTAGTITASLSGNASTATTATNFSGALSGDVTGTQSATVVSLVGTSSAAQVHNATVAANSATSTNTASTIVLRDASGNFSAGTITAAGINVTGLSASLPVLTDASKNLVSGNIALGSQVSGTLPVANGGTNSAVTLNNNRIMVSSAGAIKEAAALTNGQLLIGSTGAAPIASTITSSGATLTVTPSAGGLDLAVNNISLTTQVTGILPIANGGTNSNTALNNNRIVLTSGGKIVEGGALTNGQFFLGATASSPAAGTITSTGGSLTVTPGTNTINLDVTSNTSPFAFAYDTASTNVTAANTYQNVKFSNSTLRNWTYVAATGVFTCPTTASYIINYTCVTTCSNPTQTFYMDVTRNGIEIAGSQTPFQIPTANSPLPISNSIIQAFTAADTMAIRMAGTATSIGIVAAGLGGTNSSATVTISLV